MKLTNKQYSKLNKAFANNYSADTKIRRNFG